MQLDLIRTCSSDKFGTFGIIRLDQVPFALTLEPPWADNKPFVSCIPTGSYVCRRVLSKRFGETFEVMDVPGRTRILFHKGNTAQDTEGCIILGRGLSGSPQSPSIYYSDIAMSNFLEHLKGEESFVLAIYAPPATTGGVKV
jgi:hypothetical protein